RTQQVWVNNARPLRYCRSQQASPRGPIRRTKFMRAVVVSAFGGPEVLTEAELPDPEPGPGQITIDTSHLVVRDIGGRIGFERAITHPERVSSLTVLNSPVDVAVFRRPWPIHPSPTRDIGKDGLPAVPRPPLAPAGLRWDIPSCRHRRQRGHIERRGQRLRGADEARRSRQLFPEDHALI